MFEKLKQFKDLRDKAKTIQTALAEEKVEGTGGWNKITIAMDGNMTVLAVSVDPSLLAPSEQSKVQDGIKEALADAIKKAQMKAMKKMQEMGGLEGLGA
jgi:DNA-binding YbaB/EbfC family protein